jgi:hypothetical protein
VALVGTCQPDNKEGGPKIARGWPLPEQTRPARLERRAALQATHQSSGGFCMLYPAVGARSNFRKLQMLKSIPGMFTRRTDLSKRQIDENLGISSPTHLRTG